MYRSAYMTRCGCGGTTSKAYARAHGGKCKACATGSEPRGKQVWYGGVRMAASKAPGGHCEDAPCCGCCGPGSDDPAYHESDPYDREDYR
jgi:hypothetical protein